jgi:hypothetical protein
MFKNNNKLKALVLSFGLGAAMLTTTSVQAQGVFGDMLDNYYSEKESSSNAGALLRGNGDREVGINQGFTLGGADSENPIQTGSIWGFDLGGGTEENPTPLGNGIAILVAAGAGYVTLKKKMEEKQ